MHVYINICICLYIYIHVVVCVCTYIHCVCVYAHTHTNIKTFFLPLRPILYAFNLFGKGNLEKVQNFKKYLTAFRGKQTLNPLLCFHASPRQDTIKSLKICSAPLQRLCLNCNSLAPTAVHSMSH